MDLSSSLCGCLPKAKSNKIPSKPSFSYGFPLVFLWFFMIFLWFSYCFPLSHWSRPQIQVPRAPRFSASPRSCAAPWPPERWPGSPSPAVDSCQEIPYDLDMVYIYIYMCNMCIVCMYGWMDGWMYSIYVHVHTYTYISICVYIYTICVYWSSVFLISDTGNYPTIMPYHNMYLYMDILS